MDNQLSPQHHSRGSTIDRTLAFIRQHDVQVHAACMAAMPQSVVSLCRHLLTFPVGDMSLFNFYRQARSVPGLWLTQAITTGNVDSLPAFRYAINSIDPPESIWWECSVFQMEVIMAIRDSKHPATAALRQLFARQEKSHA